MDWSYDAWPSGEPYDWNGAERGHSVYDAFDYHIDLGCGKLKKGRIGIDIFPSPGVNIVMDLNRLAVYGLPAEVGGDAPSSRPQTEKGEVYALQLGLPFDSNSIESVISHHALEHIGTGFIPLMDEVYRVLKPGGIFRAITPLFPSKNAVEDPSHVRYFAEGTWGYLCGTPDNCWVESFSVHYTSARFEMVDHDISPPTPPEKMWGPDDAREIRVALKAMK